MKKIWIRRVLSVLLIITLFFQNGTVKAENQKSSEEPVSITGMAGVLMEASTGKVLYEKNKDEQRMIASITKIMTLLLIFEALDSGKIKLTDQVSVSEHAASMGGSQVYLEPGEIQSVEDMIKCISIASANDASVAMAEFIAGSESEFVNQMNDRALELGMKNTHFMNCCGLDDDIEKGHYSSAYDIALMSKELITKHPQIQNYCTVWMDQITHTTKKGTKEFGLTNTNRLIRTYDGITGLKTGSTSKAKFCLSATARRKDMDMIAVVLASESPKDRFLDASKLLDYGFASCELYKDPKESNRYTDLAVKKGKKKAFSAMAEKDFSYIFTDNHSETEVEKEIVWEENLKAPIKKGDKVGKIGYYLTGKEIGEVDIIALEDVEKAGYNDCVFEIFQRYIHDIE